MKKLLLAMAFACPIATFAQLHLNLFGGFSNYQGDLQDKPLTLAQSNGAFGIGLQYDITHHFSVRSAFNLAKVSADDKKNTQPDLVARNLSFKSHITEGNVELVYNLFDDERSSFTPYVFGGVAVYHFNPYAYDSLGHRHDLRPLSTEGQGLAQYPNKKEYKLTQLAIPFGAGVKFRIAENMTLGYEIGLRKLFTDYLDDVSTTYVDQVTLINARGATAASMAYRGAELKNGAPYPADGTVRGGSKFKDWYYFSGLSLSIGIANGQHRGSSMRSGKSKTDCPKPVL
jgi:opacity protein-like surface antigen